VIKSITILRKAESAAEYKSLSALLESLGFERGREWKNAPGAGGKVTRGTAFHAPVGAIEILERMPEEGGDIWVEVSDLEAVHRQGKKRGERESL